MTAGPIDGVAIAERAVDHPDAVLLLRAFYAEQVQRYGFADPIDLDPAEYERPNGVFAVAYHQGRPVGCGGYRWYDRAAGTIEIKKTYLVPELRGRGAGRAMLTWLETDASASGARRVILETGVRNSAALHLFARAGYGPTPRYVAGRDPNVNRAFAKALTERASSHSSRGHP
jgi:GNAT superfamily N-acetyltransferase